MSAVAQPVQQTDPMHTLAQVYALRGAQEQSEYRRQQAEHVQQQMELAAAEAERKVLERKQLQQGQDILQPGLLAREPEEAIAARIQGIQDPAVRSAAFTS